jgi:hypothetical protein
MEKSGQGREYQSIELGRRTHEAIINRHDVVKTAVQTILCSQTAVFKNINKNNGLHNFCWRGCAGVF